LKISFSDVLGGQDGRFLPEQASVKIHQWRSRHGDGGGVLVSNNKVLNNSGD